MRLTMVVGARPNFVKAAAVMRAVRRRSELQTRLVHTGQHYDASMSASFFQELQLPEPDAFFGVGSASHAIQTARVMERFDEELDAHPTDCVIVFGDVNSTLASALVAAKRGVRVAHVEAGLRSGDRSMPEEINRILTDRLADVLFATERDAVANLLAEGIPPERVHLVGNVMADSLLHFRMLAQRSDILTRLGRRTRDYAICTLHRPSNVDSAEAAALTVEAIERVCACVPVIFPVHPRTRTRWLAFGLLQRLAANARVQVVEPLGYLDFLCLMDGARLVLTDSGGIQEETTVLGVPCLTFRETTERPITIACGTNRLVGTDPEIVAAEVETILTTAAGAATVPEFWDGRASQRILDLLCQSAHTRVPWAPARPVGAPSGCSEPD